MLLGRLLAEAGATVACGGYAGTMEAVSRGASDCDGRVIGYTLDGMAGRRANRYLSEERRCTTLYQRLESLIHGSDALVAVGGGIGTLVEVFLAWNEIYLGLIDPRPLIVVGPEWAGALDALASVMEIGPHHDHLVTTCAGVEDVVSELRSQGVLSRG